MLKPAVMSRVLITGTKDELESVISILHSLNLLHINDFNETSDDFKIGKPLKAAKTSSELLLLIRSISSQLGIQKKELISKKESLDNLNEKINSLHNKVSALIDELRNIEFEIKQKQDLITEITPFFALSLNLENYRSYETLAVFTGYINADIEKKISKLTKNYEIFSGEHEKKTIFALFVPKTLKQEVQKILQDESTYIELKPPELNGKPNEVVEKLKKEISELKEKEKSIQSELDKLKSIYTDFILIAEEHLSIEVEKSEAPLKFATSDNAFVIDGWIPSDKYDLLKSKLSEKVYITKTDEKEDYKEIPIKLDNPKITEPFELLTETFSIPKYKEIDPSIILFITFPLFYGLMLGDIGYGILVSILAIAIKKKFPSQGLKSLAMMLLFSGISSTFFGIIYGEFFGVPIFNEIKHGEVETGLLGIHGPTILGLEIPVARFESVEFLLVVSLIIGIIHVFLGLILGFRNVVITHGLKHAIYEKGSWMLILLGGVDIVAKIMPSLMNKTPMDSGIAVYLGFAAFLIGVILLVIGEGPISIMEIPTIMSNILSYSRILAIGLSSAGIALAVNTLSSQLFIKPDGVLFGGGILLALIGMVILLIGHIINLALGILGPGIHSLRLQYVEFFTKFYEGGGKKYTPFGYNKKYTED